MGCQVNMQCLTLWPTCPVAVRVSQFVRFQKRQWCRYWARSMRCWAPALKQPRPSGPHRESRDWCSLTRTGKGWSVCLWDHFSIHVYEYTLWFVTCISPLLFLPLLSSGVTSNRSEREVRGAGLVLQTVWGYKELRRTLEKDGWKKTDFMVNLNPSSINRSNGGYEDSTLPLIDRGQEVNRNTCMQNVILCKVKVQSQYISVYFSW